VLLAAVLLVLGAAGLFAAGLAQGSAALQWASFASSLAAAAVLALGAVTRRSARTHRPAARPALAPAGAPRAPAAADAGVAAPTTGAHAVREPAAAGAVVSRAEVTGADPGVEEVAVADLLLVLDLTTDVLVVDEHPRYHLPGCPHLRELQTVPLPMVEARTDGFTPCAVCTPDHVLADRERSRRTG
jgi:hypothetical protein